MSMTFFNMRRRDAKKRAEKSAQTKEKTSDPVKKSIRKKRTVNKDDSDS